MSHSSCLVVQIRAAICRGLTDREINAVPTSINVYKPLLTFQCVYVRINKRIYIQSHVGKYVYITHNTNDFAAKCCWYVQICIAPLALSQNHYKPQRTLYLFSPLSLWLVSICLLPRLFPLSSLPLSETICTIQLWCLKRYNRAHTCHRN